jgi:LacI family transcriptional regulator
VAGLTPALTTIDIRAETIGRRAVERLLWRIDHPKDNVPTKVVVEPVVVEGKSVAEVNS